MASAGPPQLSDEIELLEEGNLPRKARRFSGNVAVDFLLLTVKPCEYESCFSYLQEPVRYKVKDVGLVFIGNMGDADEELTVALMKCDMGSGVGGSAMAVQNAVKALKPKGVFCVGFCGGMNAEKAKLGDVVVSTKLILYASVKATNEGIQARGLSVPLSKNLNDIIKYAGVGWNPPVKDPKQKGKVLGGVMLSGPELVNDITERDRLLKQYPDAIAIEMEGEGVYTAAHDLKQMEWVVVKGISDYADGTKSATKDWQRYSSVMAASVVANILSQSLIFEDWPHYGGGLSAQSPTVASKRARIEPSLCPVPDQDRRVKVDPVSDDDWEKLAHLLGDSWEKLGRRLKVGVSELPGLRRNNQEYPDLSDKAREMLRRWRNSKGDSATYQSLYDALCHEFVQRRDLAEKICCE